MYRPMLIQGIRVLGRVTRVLGQGILVHGRVTPNPTPRVEVILHPMRLVYNFLTHQAVCLVHPTLKEDLRLQPHRLPRKYYNETLFFTLFVLLEGMTSLLLLLYCCWYLIYTRMEFLNDPVDVLFPCMPGLIMFSMEAKFFRKIYLLQL